MEVDLDIRFEKQKRLYSFCFTCEHCAHFDDESFACMHGFPNDVHRLSYYEGVPRPAKLIFCKEFDFA